MKKTNTEIISQIRALLDELEQGHSLPVSSPKGHASVAIKKLSGCSGAIQTLIEERFLDKPKTVSQVVEKLIEEGQPYTKQLVSMNLLNLVKPPRKTLRRLKQEDQWHYIIRK